MRVMLQSRRPYLRSHYNQSYLFVQYILTPRVRSADQQATLIYFEYYSHRLNSW